MDKGIDVWKRIFPFKVGERVRITYGYPEGREGVIVAVHWDGIFFSIILDVSHIELYFGKDQIQHLWE